MKSLQLLAIAAFVLAAPAAAQFGDLGGLINKAKSVQKIGDGLKKISEPEEIKIGGDLAGIILGAAPLTQDPAKQRYVGRVGKWIALHSERPNLPWKFGIVESPDFNAFSMPGGYVLVTRGLFDQMRSESELAGVLAHEVAHVVQRHHIKAIEKSMRGEALGEMQKYLHPAGNGVADQFTQALMTAGRNMFIQGLDKNDEYEADRMGAVLAARSGYSPYGLAGVLQTLSGAPQTRNYALHNKTHPEPVDRITRLDAAMGSRFDTTEGLVDDVPGFAAMRSGAAPAGGTRPRGKGKRS
jgi:beta-barrel assembly-enhancing protease